MNSLYVATIQVVVPVASDRDEVAFAQDYIAETLRELFTDWAYLKIGGQYQYPHRLELRPETYKEGDFLQ